MDLRLPPRRIFHALGTVFLVVTVLLFQFRVPGNSAWRNQRWAATSGLTRDIQNSTLGVSSLGFGCPLLSASPVSRFAAV